jgi:hypothetical protein
MAEEEHADGDACRPDEDEEERRRREKKEAMDHIFAAQLAEEVGTQLQRAHHQDPNDQELSSHSLLLI